MMLEERSQEKTRQIYASIREDLYLSAKAKASQLRIPLKKFLEQALELALGNPGSLAVDSSRGTTWEIENLKAQLAQPLGNPVSLTSQEAEAVLREASAVRTYSYAVDEVIQGPQVREAL